MAQIPKECGTVLTSGGFEPPIPKEGDMPAALKAMATKDAGPPIPTLTAAQLQALTGSGPGGMPLPDRNPMR
jgi:penicillin-insensitive murein endopeptidase